MKHLKSKISRVLVLYIVLFSSVVTLSLTAIQLRMDYVDGISVIHQRIDQIRVTNTESIKQSLWTMDHSSMQIQLDGLSRIPDIIFVSMVDQNNKLIASAGAINTKNTVTDKIKLSQLYRGKENTLGVLTVEASKENIYQQLINTVIIILISQAIKTFLVSMFVVVIFYYLVTRHLMKIAEHSSRLELKQKPSPLVLDRKSSVLLDGDELSQVVSSINQMSENIYMSYMDLINSQNQLSEREAKFSAMFDSISDSVVFADVERKILQTNPAFHAQFGYNKEDLKNQTTALLYANPDDYLQQGKTRFNPTAGPTSSVFEVEYRRKDGSVFSSETLGGSVTLPDKTQLGFIGVIRDITARKQASDEKMLLQKQLHQAQKMEAIGQLTGGIAHDFNNILTSILGYSELIIDLLQSSTEPKLTQYMQRINSAGERARDLVSQLLAFSRSAPSDPKPLKLPVLIDDVLALIRPTIPSNIELKTELDDKVPAVLMDQTQMHQMLMNLCINARDAMTGSGVITIKLSHEKNLRSVCNSCNKNIQGEYVNLSVADTGSGITSNILGNIFEPFHTTKEIGKGTGMGLSVVHGILHKHNAHVMVATESGVGTRFSLLIPAIDEKDIPDEIESNSIKIDHNDGKNKHLLIVDDESSVAMFMNDFFDAYDYKVTVTTSSTEALAIFKQTPNDYDLIITDQTMPELTGIEMIKLIFEINPHVPVILCSGYSELINEEQALELGVSKYLSKPINNQVLLQSVHDILSKNIS